MTKAKLKAYIDEDIKSLGASESLVMTRMRNKSISNEILTSLKLDLSYIRGRLVSLDNIRDHV